MAEQEDFLRPLIQEVVQQVMKAEMDEALGAEKGERSPKRLGYRSGYYGRTLVTRVGKLELRCRRTGKEGFGRKCLNVTSVARKRWWVP
jgi:transposase-like protein